MDILSDDQQTAWKAVRLRVSQEMPWMTPALFRAVPVAVESATVDADGWGRIYTDFSLEGTLGMPKFAEKVVNALGDWVRGDTSAQPWHEPPTSDPDDGSGVPPPEAVPSDDLDDIANLVAVRFIHDAAAPDPYGKGDPLANWRKWAADIAGPAQVPWQSLLGGYLRQAVGWKAGSVDYTYSRPSRRRVPGVALPAMRHPVLDMAVVADVSGSLHKHLPQVAGEVWRISRSAGVDPRSVTVVACDDEVVETFVSAPTPPDLPRGKGKSTDLRVGIEHALTLRPSPGVIIVLTDGFTPWPELPPSAPMIVALMGTDVLRKKALVSVPEWASVVQIDTDTTED